MTHREYIPIPQNEGAFVDKLRYIESRNKPFVIGMQLLAHLSSPARYHVFGDALYKHTYSESYPRHLLPQIKAALGLEYNM